MNQLRIPAVPALMIGLAVAIWGSRLPLNQNNLAEQSTGEWMISTALTVGGVLIVMMAAFGLGRSSKK